MTPTFIVVVEEEEVELAEEVLVWLVAEVDSEEAEGEEVVSEVAEVSVVVEEEEGVGTEVVEGEGDTTHITRIF